MPQDRRSEPSAERPAGEPVPRPYEDAASAVGAEMARIALTIRRALHDGRHAPRFGPGTGPGTGPGAGISPGTAPGAGTVALPPDSSAYDGKQAERELLRLEFPQGRAPRSVDPEIATIEPLLVQRQQRNARDREVTNIELPLYTLKQRAGLDDLAFDLFLLALAPEIDEGFGRVFALLRGGRAQKLDVASAARVLCPDEVGAAGVRMAIAPGSPLFDLSLIDIGSPEGGGASTLAASLSVPPPVVAHVLGQPVQDPVLRSFVALDTHRQAFPRKRTYLPDALFSQVTALLADRGAVACLEGPPGSGKHLLLRALCAEQKKTLLEVDLSLAPEGFSEREALSVVRLAWLRDAVVLLALPPFDPSEPPHKVKAGWISSVTEVLSRFPGTVVLCRDTVSVFDTAHLDLRIPRSHRLAPISIAPPDAATREALWRDRLGLGDAAGAVDLLLLARTHPLTGGVITRIAAEARVQAAARGPQALPTLDDVARSIEAEFRPRLQAIGRRLLTEAGFPDLVVPDETLETLQEMQATVRLRHQVLEEWRFGKLVRGRGVSALFYGEPGTGKTLAAGIIAKACGLSLYQIDTAQVVSKWIGETEKNLAEVFRAAEAGQAMLLFDEADAIFGKRTDVQNSTDRFANMQTNFLLTQIETFDGVVILTTNRESVMDSAFQRRLSFRVSFPMPEEKEREDLWRRMLAGHTDKEVVGQISYPELAKRLRMSGGYIRNAVLRAAYLGAAQGKPLDTPLLRHAAELVLRDAGRVI